MQWQIKYCCKGTQNIQGFHLENNEYRDESLDHTLLFPVLYLLRKDYVTCLGFESGAILDCTIILISHITFFFSLKSSTFFKAPYRRAKLPTGKNLHLCTCFYF